MLAKMIPALNVATVNGNVEYLIKTLGFHLDWLAEDEDSAVMNYQGALLLLRAQKPVGGAERSTVEIMIRIQGGVDDIYGRALARGASIRRPLATATESAGLPVRQFSVSLPDGYVLTFFEYAGGDERPPEREA